ncbi:hypothetical protein [Congregibacter litoralis]|uniref:Uncharacterized protein n=1 Tax=Congregibacter litoralis KT71 TaxID=314285 RepID=A4ADI4_9GAMM|nr:hypothetical protein [Congregibacter litoralis]EAQ95982.2 hypothetical protein KT71_18302 [Congregibacter litoralis KT71]
MNEAEARLVYEEAQRDERVMHEFESLRPSYNPVVSAVSNLVAIALFMWFIMATETGRSMETTTVSLMMFMLVAGNQAVTQELNRRTNKRIDALYSLLRRDASQDL